VTELTYGRLEQLMRSLGFSVHLLEGEARGYQHESGARLTLPNLPEQETVLPRHLMAVRTILEAFGIPEPAELAQPTQRVG
jgi:hypothetical protein